MLALVIALSLFLLAYARFTYSMDGKDDEESKKSRRNMSWGATGVGVLFCLLSLYSYSKQTDSGAVNWVNFGFDTEETMFYNISL